MEICMLWLNRRTPNFSNTQPRMLSVPSPTPLSSKNPHGSSSAFSLILSRNIKIFSASCRCVLFFSYIRLWITLNNKERLFIANGEDLTHYVMIKHFTHLWKKEKRRKHYPQNCNITSSALCWMFTEQHWKSLKCQIVISSCVRPPTNKWFIFLSTDTSKKEERN